MKNTPTQKKIKLILCNKRFSSLLIVFVLTATFTVIRAQTWNIVGTAGFSAAEADFTSIALDAGGTPYVVFKDFGNGGKATVMKYNGSSWIPVGSAGFSLSNVAFTSIAIDGSGTPYVVYEDYGNGQKATVMKYTGSAWVDIGSPGFSPGGTAYNTIAIDRTGTPYVIFQDDLTSSPQKATVMKFNGSSWVNVGIPDFSGASAYSTSIAFNSSGVPYVVYGDYSVSGKASSMKFDGTSWVPVGTLGFSAGETYESCVAIGANDTPYVVYQDWTTSYKASVMRFNGSSWVTTGTAGFSAGEANFTSIAVGTNDTPFVVYQDGGYSQKATSMKYNGTNWITAGSAGFSAAEADYTAMAIDAAGSVYVVYSDFGNGQKATVMKLGTTLPPITGGPGLCIGDSTALSDITTGGTWSISNTAVATIDSTSGTATGISAGTAIITYTTDSGFITKIVSINPLPHPILSDTLPCGLKVPDVYLSYKWYFAGSPPYFTGDTTYYIEFSATTEYNYVVVDSNGCLGSSDTVIRCGDAVANVSNPTHEISIYPNPATISLSISSTNQPINILTITNLLGQTLFNNEYNTEAATIDVANLPSGMYLIKINGSEVRKFVKE